MENEHTKRFKQQLEIHVRFMDIDALNHVNNARYLNFLEEARIAYCKDALGITFGVDDFHILVARIEIDFIKPILLHSKLRLYTRVKKIGGKSFTFETLIYNLTGANESLVSKADQVLVCFDPETGKSSRISADLRAKIEQFESHT